MLVTFLSVLKIIGIVLLWIFGIILGLILLILFWPFHYSIGTTNRDNFSAKINVSYFFHFISVWAIYDSGINFRVKILGIPIYDHKKKKAKLEKESNIDLDDDLNDLDSSEADLLSSESNEFSKTEEDASESAELKITDSKSDDLEKINADVINVESESDNKANINDFFDDNNDNLEISNDNTDSPDDDSVDNENKKSLFEKIEDIIDSIKNKLIEFYDKASNFLDEFSLNSEKKINDIVETIDYYDRLFSKKATESVIEFVKKKLFQLIKIFKPNYGKIFVDYASVEPDKAAKMYELYAYIIPFMPRIFKKTRFTSNFDDEYFYFDFLIKGYFVLGFILIIGLQVFFNRKLRKFIKLLKREK